MKKLCVIGDPVAHSLSPLIQNAMLQSLGLSYEYSAVLVERGRIKEWLDRALAEDYAGFNVTMPHKEALVKLMDTLSPDAAACASVNTVCIKNGKLYGFSTDGEGFLRALTDAGVSPKGEKILLLGAGGAARAVTLKLVQAGAKQVAVCNRTEQKAKRLCRANPDILHTAPFTAGSLRSEASDAALLVNCTSLGMAGTNGGFEDLSFLDAMPPDAAVFDLIYNPAETELLARAKARGLCSINGLDMLIHQAICALEHFTGVLPDHRSMYDAAKKALNTW